MHFRASLSKYKSEIYNLGHGNPQSINYLTKLIGKNSKVFIPKRPAEPEKTFADISKIKKDLKWKPVISFEKGMKAINNQYPIKIKIEIPNKLFQLQLRYNTDEIKKTIPILWSTPGSLIVSKS